MKKLFSIFTLTIMFLAVSTVANAQWSDSRFGGHGAHANDQADYNRCRDEVRSGDYNYQYGLYEASLSHYEKARHYNNCCRPDHRYISTSEIDRRIDDCRRAMHRNDRPAPRHTTYHHSSSSSKDAAVGAAVGGVLLAAAIGAAVASSKKSAANNQAKQQTVDNPNNVTYTSNTTAASNQQLRHYDNGYVTYDATCSDLQIKSIDRTPEGTVVNFEFLNVNKADNIYMARSVYMKDRSTNQKYRSIDTTLDCTKRTHVDQGDSYEFSVTFPAVADNCHEIDIVESPTSSWKFYHVNF